MYNAEYDELVLNISVSFNETERGHVARIQTPVSYSKSHESSRLGRLSVVASRTEYWALSLCSSQNSIPAELFRYIETMLSYHCFKANAKSKALWLPIEPGASMKFSANTAVGASTSCLTEQSVEQLLCNVYARKYCSTILKLLRECDLGAKTKSCRKCRAKKSIRQRHKVSIKAHTSNQSNETRKLVQESIIIFYFRWTRNTH